MQRDINKLNKHSILSIGEIFKIKKIKKRIITHEAIVKKFFGHRIIDEDSYWEELRQNSIDEDSIQGGLIGQSLDQRCLVT